MILSYLPPHDLAVVSSLSSRWLRMASDNTIWKHLFQQTYAATAGSLQPTRLAADWKSLFRLQTNVSCPGFDHLEHLINPSILVADWLC